MVAPRRRRRHQNRFLDNVGRISPSTIAMFGIAVLLLFASAGIVGLTMVRRSSATTADQAADGGADLLRGDRRDCSPDAGPRDPDRTRLAHGTHVRHRGHAAADRHRAHDRDRRRCRCARLRAVEGRARRCRCDGDHARRDLATGAGRLWRSTGNRPSHCPGRAYRDRDQDSDSGPDGWWEHRWREYGWRQHRRWQHRRWQHRWRYRPDRDSHPDPRPNEHANRDAHANGNSDRHAEANPAPGRLPRPGQQDLYVRPDLHPVG